MAITYSKIASTTLNSNTGTVTFNSISSNYTDLVLIVAGTEDVQADGFIRFNSDSASNYARIAIYPLSGSISALNQGNQTGVAFSYFKSGIGVATVNIFNYASTSTYKPVITYQSADDANQNSMTIANWFSTAAITSISIISGDGVNYLWQSGTVFSLYGIKAA